MILELKHCNFFVFICRMLPNADHGMYPYYNRTLETIAGFWLTILRVSLLLNL